MFKKKTTGLVVLTYLSSDAQAVKMKYRPVPGSAPWYKEASWSTWERPDWDVNYFVPNFGQDNTIMESIDNM